MHDKSIEKVIKLLNTSFHGLSDEEAEKRLKIYGPNEIIEKKESKIKIFLKQYNNSLVYILITAGILSFLMNKIYETIIIFLLIFINGIISFYFENKALVSMEYLKKLEKRYAKVIRNGKIKEIEISKLVPGDIVIIKEGDVVPADIRLIEAKNLLIDESMLTGESYPVEKKADIVLKEDTPIYERINCSFKGTFIVNGEGKGVVYATGMNTEMGKIVKRISEKGYKTPFFESFEKFSRIWVSLNVIYLTLVVVIVYYIYNYDLFTLLLFALSQMISVIPAGLPIVITLSLAVGAHSLYKNKVLVKYLPVVEALGNIEYLLVDKTGTITLGKLKVHKFYTIDEEKLYLCSALCNYSDGISGDPIDLSLLKWLEEINIDWKKIREEYEYIEKLPFDYNKKYTAVIVEKDKKKYLFIKGAFESLSNIAINYHKDWKKIHDHYASEGLRVLAFGYKEIDDNFDINNINSIELIGLIAFLDPPKEKVKEAIEIAKKAGIKIIMITGDNILTAKTIAKEIGLFTKDSLALEGKDIKDLDDKSLYNLLKKTTVVARALPEDKYRIAKVLIENGHIVGVTGDGVNDSPALKIAHVSISMGSGSQVAKEVSKLVLIEDNLYTIVEGILEGRKIAKNIASVNRYLFSTNMFEVLFNSSSTLLGLPLPLYPTQILWINLVTDGVQDKTFAFTKHSEKILEQPPKNPKRLFFGKKQIIRILMNSTFLAISHVLLYIYLIKIFPFEVVRTILFISVSASQWSIGIQEISTDSFIRNPKEYIKKNKYIYIGISIGFLLLMFAVIYGNAFFKTVLITPDQMVYGFIIPLITFFFMEFRKWIDRKYLSRF